MLAQTSPDFTFDQTQIVLYRDTNKIDDFKIYRGQITESDLSTTNPILGEIREEDKRLHFFPLVPFTYNQEYTIVYENIIDYFIIKTPPKSYKPLKVEAIYPSSKILPSNILKWYIQFSNPISEVFVYNHIRFLNAVGDTIPRSILPLENALISDNGKLLTVWIEPGRQKRGLIPNTKLGPVFNKDGFNKYSLVVLKTLEDQNGVGMKKDFMHSFQTTIADRNKPTINSWNLIPPKINSTSSLIIDCNESLDYGSTLNNISILHNKENEIQGTWKLSDHETILEFTPIYPWKKGIYHIVFSPKIEDLAGNSLERLFDHKINELTDDNSSNSIYEYKIQFILK